MNFLLVVVNLVIVAAAELAGGGKFLFESGLIHAVAILFILLATIPLFKGYYLADPIFKKFLNACLGAFGVFSLSHVLEFIGYKFFGGYGSYIYALTLNFYLISILIMIAGSEIFLRANDGYKNSRLFLVSTDTIIVSLALLSVVVFFNNSLISLESEDIYPYIYSASVALIALFFWRRISRLVKIFPQLSKFFNLLKLMVVSVLVSSFFYAFYDFFESFNLPVYQIVYFSHFVFYAGMSFMFLAFRKLNELGGVVKDIRERIL